MEWAKISETGTARREWKIYFEPATVIKVLGLIYKHNIDTTSQIHLKIIFARHHRTVPVKHLIKITLNSFEDET
jgi:hypothetical protein